MSTWNPGAVILNEYTLEKELGRGGMGRVWLVKSNSTGHRFAVKQAMILEEKHRKAFLAELQTWIDLPEHPNIVPCRFFRTVEGEVLIFSEYVDGGSLKNWIDSGRLYEGNHQQALKRILDTAIQFAWGLCSLHELGLVHQDVKPGNVLMAVGAEASVQGIRAQVADYGLARARAGFGGQEAWNTGEGSILLSSGGYTPAYCSPEQAKGLPVTSKTDIWSWGVSVLEMFTGGVTWHSGQLAGAVLDQYVEEADESSDSLPVPLELVDILKGCFHNEPAQRWANLGEVVTHLRTAYLSITEEDYDRELFRVAQRAEPKAGVSERRMAYGGEWTNPREWIESALRLDGRDPAEAEEILAHRVASRRGQLVAELAMFEEAKGILDRLVNTGRQDLNQNLASLCMEKAFVHETSDDFSGALAEYDQCIAIRHRLVEQEGRCELADDLAMALMNKANAVQRMGDLAGAVKLYDQCITIRKRLVEQEGRRELAANLANAIMNKANAVQRMGDLAGAVKLYDECIAIRRRLVEQEDRWELANGLAGALMNKAIALNSLGELAGAVKLYGECIAIRRRLVEQEDRWELAHRLARALMNKAVALDVLGDLADAMKLYDECIAICQRLVEQEGRRELADELAAALMSKANALNALGDLAGAVKLYDQCIAIRQRLVEQEGRRELAADLARALMNKAVALKAMGDLAGAVKLYDQCTAILQRLVEQEGRREFANGLAMTLMNKAIALKAMGDLAGAVKLYDQCITIRKRLVEQEGRRELANELVMPLMNKAIALKAMGDLAGAVKLYDECIAIRRQLVEQEGRSELQGDLAWNELMRASCLLQQGDMSERDRTVARTAFATLADEARRTGRADLLGVQQWAKEVLRDVL